MPWLPRRLQEVENRKVIEGFGEQIFQLMLSRTTKQKEWAEWLRGPLAKACDAGQGDLVDKLLEAGADGSAGWRGKDGRTLLHAAAMGGSEQAVWSLLNAGAKPDIDVEIESRFWPKTPLQFAANCGHRDAARALVAAGADVSLALHLAVTKGNEPLALDLLVAGADPNEIENVARRPLMRACEKGLTRLVRALLERKAETVAARGGVTLLHAAARGGHVSTAKALLAAGVGSVGDFTSAGETPLHSAASRYPERYTRGPIVKMLCDAGADIEAQHLPRGGLTPLHLAAENGNYDGALVLLQHGASVDSLTNTGKRPLHVACFYLKPEIVELLLCWGADETALDKSGRTAAAWVDTVESIHANHNHYGSDSDGAEQMIEAMEPDLEARERVLALLHRAPNDRAWRRRRFLVLCRAHPEKLRLEVAPRKMAHGGANGAGSKVASKFPRTESAAARGTAGGSATRGDDPGGAAENAAGGQGFDVVAAWLMDQREDGIFRQIVQFL